MYDSDCGLLRLSVCVFGCLCDPSVSSPSAYVPAFLCDIDLCHSRLLTCLPVVSVPVYSVFVCPLHLCLSSPCFLGFFFRRLCLSPPSLLCMFLRSSYVLVFFCPRSLSLSLFSTSLSALSVLSVFVCPLHLYLLVFVSSSLYVLSLLSALSVFSVFIFRIRFCLSYPPLSVIALFVYLLSLYRIRLCRIHMCLSYSSLSVFFLFVVSVFVSSVFVLSIFVYPSSYVASVFVGRICLYLCLSCWFLSVLPACRPSGCNDISPLWTTYEISGNREILWSLCRFEREREKGAWQGSHWNANSEVTGMTRHGQVPTVQAGIEPRIFRSRG